MARPTWGRRAAHASVVDVLDLEPDQPRAQRDVLVREPVKDRLVDGDVGGEVIGDGVDLAGVKWKNALAPIYVRFLYNKRTDGRFFFFGSLL